MNNLSVPLKYSNQLWFRYIKTHSIAYYILDNLPWKGFTSANYFILVVISCYFGTSFVKLLHLRCFHFCNSLYSGVYIVDMLLLLFSHFHTWTSTLYAPAFCNSVLDCLVLSVIMTTLSDGLTMSSRQPKSLLDCNVLTPDCHHLWSPA